MLLSSEHSDKEIYLALLNKIKSQYLPNLSSSLFDQICSKDFSWNDRKSAKSNGLILSELVIQYCLSSTNNEPPEFQYFVRRFHLEKAKSFCMDRIAISPYTIIKLKPYNCMTEPENFTLLKPQITTEQQTAYNIVELRAQFKKKEGMIAEFSKRIEQKREQMKNLSKTVNVLIEKQFKKPIKQRPSFHVTYSSPKLNALRDQKNKIFMEIERIKQAIKAQKLDHPESIVNQVLANEAKIAQLEKDIAKALDAKALVTRTLQENKVKIDEMKLNNSLNDLQKKQAELANIKKQCKQLEKQINMFSSQQLQKSTFFFEMKDRVQEEVIQEKIEVQIDTNQLKEMLREINQIYEKRRIVQLQGSIKIKNQEKLIEDLEKSITQKKTQIRQLQNDVLRAALSKKRMHSMVNLRNQYSNNKANPLPPKEKPVEKKKLFNPEQKKAQKRVINKIYMIQKDDANCIYIGEWVNDTKVISDKPQISLNSIEKVKSFMFSLSNGRVIGLQPSYIDKNGTVITGKELGANVEGQMKVEINIEQVAQLEYSRKSEEFYIRFILNNGSWKELGQRGTQVQKINLQPYYVRYVEVLANDAKTYLTSLKLTLQEKIPQKLGLSDVAERTSSQMSYSNFDSSVKKKVVLKGRSLKRIQQQPIVDHRLMLNKQK